MSSDKSSDKPFLKMDELEFRRTFDELGTNIRVGMLDEARSSAEESRTFTFSVVMLRTVPKSEGAIPFDGMTIAYWNPEYGDDEGRSSMADFVREVRRSKDLREGESVERYLAKVSLDDGKFILSLDEVKTNTRKRKGRR